MRIEHLQEYLVLAETRNFTETAKRCNVSQSALSKHIASMEAEVGSDLLKRPSNPVRLTKAGWSLAHDARIIVNEWVGTLGRIEAIRQEGSESITLGYYYAASVWALGNIHAWVKRNVTNFQIKPVSLSPAEIESALIEKRVDAAVTIDPDGRLEPLCNYVHLKDEHMLLAVSKKHPLAKYDTVKLADLEDELFLRPGPQVWSTIGNHLESVFGELPGYRNGRMLDDVETVLLGVQGNMGVAVVLDHNRSNFGDRIRFLHVQEEDDSGYVVPLRLMWLKETEESHNKERYIMHLKKIFKSMTD